jgi:hypothetical protein
LDNIGFAAPKAGFMQDLRAPRADR